MLQAWGAAQVQWADDFEHGRFYLRFVWDRRNPTGGARQLFQAKLQVQLQPYAEIENMARRGGRPNRPVVQDKLKKLLAARGRREHRVLVLWLKAAFSAVQMGLITAEELFLPFMEGRDGKTVAEVALPNIEFLLSSPGKMTRFLPPSST